MDPPDSSSLESPSKHNNRAAYVENSSACSSSSDVVDPKPNSSLSSSDDNTSYEVSTDNRQDHKVRDRSGDRERNGRASGNNFRDGRSSDRFREPISAFPNYQHHYVTHPYYAGNGRNFGTNYLPLGPTHLDGMNTNSGISMNPSSDVNANPGASMNPFVTMSQPDYPGLVAGMEILSQFGMMGRECNMRIAPPKEVIFLSKCVLLPPNLSAPTPLTRIKPPGCKTVFVCGIPENGTEEIIREIFEKCGEVLTIHMSKEFCHVRFSDEASVETAVYLSGYRIRIDKKEDSPNTGIFHVFYAYASDDEYEYKCRQWLLQAPVKEIIHLHESVLYPPSPSAPAPLTRIKPPGCKTVFVGGIPENGTEEMIREVFEKCGEILTIRMSKKNFCHIRFSDEASVENAVYLSGYRMRVDNKEDGPNTGRFHVDYSHASDDKYEYECRQQLLQLEAYRRERVEQFYQTLTPPPVVHYSDHEATILVEKLRNEDTFQQAVCVLEAWIERGGCNEQNASYFYSMFQSINSHVRRLVNEKQKHEDELNNAEILLKQQMSSISSQFDGIEKVFKASSSQKVGDHFTATQRKNIELWKKQVEEVKNDHIEDEMDASDDEEDDGDWSSTDELASTVDTLKDQIHKLRKEKDALHCQLEDLKNALAVLKSETDQERELREQQMQSFQMRFQYIEGKLQDGLQVSTERLNNEAELSTSVTSTTDSFLTLTETEAWLIGIISIFLYPHTCGASINYICSYLQRIDSTIQVEDVEALLRKFSTVFKEESTGVGTDLEKKWSFCGFKST